MLVSFFFIVVDVLSFNLYAYLVYTKVLVFQILCDDSFDELFTFSYNLDFSILTSSIY